MLTPRVVCGKSGIPYGGPTRLDFRYSRSTAPANTSRSIEFPRPISVCVSINCGIIVQYSVTDMSLDQSRIPPESYGSALDSGTLATIMLNAPVY